LPVEPAIAASLEKVGLHPDESLSAYAPKFREHLPQLRDRDDLPYDLEVKEWSPEPDPESAAGIETAIGIRPAQEVVLDASVSDLQAHRVLGEFAADLAARTKGWIALGGPLCPRRWSPTRDWTPSKIRRYVAKLGLPGEVLSVEVERASRETWIEHVLDAEAMHAGFGIETFT
jgi:hypothetical protein